MVHAECDGQYCPENCIKERWLYAGTSNFVTDNNLRVECGENKIHIVEETKIDIIRIRNKGFYIIRYINIQGTHICIQVQSSVVQLCKFSHLQLEEEQEKVWNKENFGKTGNWLGRMNIIQFVITTKRINMFQKKCFFINFFLVMGGWYEK